MVQLNLSIFLLSSAVLSVTAVVSTSAKRVTDLTSFHFGDLLEAVVTNQVPANSAHEGTNEKPSYAYWSSFGTQSANCDCDCFCVDSDGRSLHHSKADALADEVERRPVLHRPRMLFQHSESNATQEFVAFVPINPKTHYPNCIVPNYLPFLSTYMLTGRIRVNITPCLEYLSRYGVNNFLRGLNVRRAYFFYLCLLILSLFYQLPNFQEGDHEPSSCRSSLKKI